MKLSGILLGSENPKRLVDYYRPLFGDPGFEDATYTGWQFDSAFFVVGPHDAVHGRNQEPGRLIWNLETSDVPADFDRLRAAGATVVQEPYHPGESTDAWIATFADPDGNYFQLVSPM